MTWSSYPEVTVTETPTVARSLNPWNTERPKARSNGGTTRNLISMTVSDRRHERAMEPHEIACGGDSSHSVWLRRLLAVRLAVQLLETSIWPKAICKRRRTHGGGLSSTYWGRASCGPLAEPNAMGATGISRPTATPPAGVAGDRLGCGRRIAGRGSPRCRADVACGHHNVGLFNHVNDAFSSRRPNCGRPEEAMRCLQASGTSCPNRDKRNQPGAGKYCHCERRDNARGGGEVHA